MTIHQVVEWLACIVAIEAVAEILSEAEVFRPLRERLVSLPGRRGWYLGGLTSCGYCLSVWLAVPCALIVPGALVPGPGGWIVADFILKIFVLHRASNAWHALIDRWTRMKPFLVSLTPPPVIHVPVADGNRGKEKAIE